MFVSDRMTKNPVTIPSSTKLDEAASLMKNDGIRRLPVVDGNSLVGIIMNAILPGKNYKFENDEPNQTGVDLEISQGKSLR